MYDIPKIRIEVENMKYQIIHAFSAHNDEIQQAVENELSRAIAEYPFADKIRAEARDVISQAIERSMKEFFVYGDGYKVIDSIVRENLKASVEK